MITFRELIPIDNNEITHKIDVGNYISNKIEAIKCHETQILLWHQFQNLKMDFDKLAKWEVFVQKWPKPNDSAIKYELFEK
jgi:hypothetical protein